ncbi:MAG: hypothetical protein MUQ30_11485 [Anaerolineae bacterium]|nr:hypothetical protein [Anaerolineae bacterium]
MLLRAQEALVSVVETIRRRRLRSSIFCFHSPERLYGQALRWQALRWQALCGQASWGQALYGKPSCGQALSWQALYGQALSWQALYGQVSDLPSVASISATSRPAHRLNGRRPIPA